MRGIRKRVIGLALVGLLSLSAEAAWAAGPSSAPAGKVPPKQWARSVCMSVDEWKTTIDDLVASMRGELGQSADLAQARDTLGTFLGDTVQATDTLVDELRQAGVPKIKNGDKIATLFNDSFADVRQLFADGQASAATLDVTDPTQFQAAASDLGNTITEGGERLERALDRAGRRYKAAKRALNDPACRSLDS